MNVFEERVKAALAIAERYGGSDGADHKAWVIDQMIRALTAHKYEQWVEEMKADSYDWDVGIPP